MRRLRFLRNQRLFWYSFSFSDHLWTVRYPNCLLKSFQLINPLTLWRVWVNSGAGDDRCSVKVIMAKKRNHRNAAWNFELDCYRTSCTVLNVFSRIFTRALNHMISYMTWGRRQEELRNLIVISKWLKFKPQLLWRNHYFPHSLIMHLWSPLHFGKLSIWLFSPYIQAPFSLFPILHSEKIGLCK